MRAKPSLVFWQCNDYSNLYAAAMALSCRSRDTMATPEMEDYNVYTTVRRQKGPALGGSDPLAIAD